MEQEIQIIPAIRGESQKDLLEKCAEVEKLVTRIQIDIVGRAFSSELSVGVEALEQMQTSAAVDVQLMVREPITFLSRCDLGGADRVFGHVEYMHDQRAFIEHAFALGMQVGLGVDLQTPITCVEKSLAEIDAILLMSVPAGRSGQTFDKQVIEKIMQVRALRADLPICVDGGIKPSVIKSLVSAGATKFAVTTFLWESKDIKQAIGDLLEAAL